MGYNVIVFSHLNLEKSYKTTIRLVEIILIIEFEIVLSVFLIGR